MKLAPSSALSRASLLACASLCAATSVHAQSGTWTSLTSGGNWSNLANWNNGIAPIADGSGNTADFSTLDLPTGVFTVNLDFSRTIGNINVGDTDAVTTAATWTLAGATTLTLAGTTPTITTGIGTTISPVIDGTTGLTKEGSANLTLNGANIYTGGTFLNAGKLTIRNAASVGAAAATITAKNGTTIRVENSIFFANPVIVSGANANVTLEWGNTGGFNNLYTGSADQKLTAAAGSWPNLSSGGKQFQNFLGTIDIPVGNGLQFRSTSLNNGGDSTTFNVDGTLSTRNGGALALGALTGNGTVAMGGSGSNNVWLTYTIGAKGESTTFGGGIVDADTANGKRVAITKTGAGTLTLSNATALTYTGTTVVNGGALKITGTKSGTGNNTVNGGGTLTGTGSVAGTTTVASTGILAPGDSLVAGGIGNITLSNLSLSTGSVLNLQFGSGNDTVTVSSGGTLGLASGTTVDVNGFDTDGVYTIMNTAGVTVTGTASTSLSAINQNPSKVYSFSNTGTAIQMTISGTDPSNYWDVDGGGAWGVAGNWTKNAIPNASEAIAKIGPGVSGLGGLFTDLAFTITLDADRTVGTLMFNDQFNTAVTVDPGISTPGSLFFDNGASAALLADMAGNHVINAPVVVDADDLGVDVVDTYSLTVNGVVSGSGAALAKTGLGTLVLAGDNTYDGGTILTGGVININSATSLGSTSAAATFSGGTLQLANSLTGITRNYLITGANSAAINTNGFDFEYAGTISPSGGGTGGLSKSGTGMLTLSTAHTYTGTTSLTGGGLNLNAGGTINGGATNISAGSNFTVAGGSLTASAASSVTGAAFNLTSGTATFSAGFNVNTGNPNSNYNVNLTGGTFSASFLTLGRSASFINTPTAGQTTVGLYINGPTASAHITGALSLGNGSGTNSTASARIDSGSLTVDGAVVVQVNSPDRWSVLDVNGGTFTSTDAVTGVQIGSGQTGSNAFLVRGGIAAVERLFLTQAAASTETSLLNVSGGTLYVGAGGIVGNNNGGTGVLDVQLGTATLGAKATWTSALGMTLSGTATIKAADALNAPFDITISGALSGTGNLEKTGAGTLTLSGTNSYTGNTTVQAGSLALSDDALSDAATVSVASGATIALSFTETDIVGALIINGVTQANGTYGAVGSGAPHETAAITGTGKLKVGIAEPFDEWMAGFPTLTGADTAKTADPDKDGESNMVEFAFDGNPASGAATGKVRSRVETVGADKALVITLPVRTGGTFAGTPSKAATIDDLIYTVEGSNNLSLFDQGITEIAESSLGMPALNTGWAYRTFRLDGAIGGATPRGPKGFVRATVADAP